eukprot:994142-Amphidinium_carterae.3
MHSKSLALESLSICGLVICSEGGAHKGAVKNNKQQHSLMCCAAILWCESCLVQHRSHRWAMHSVRVECGTCLNCIPSLSINNSRMKVWNDGDTARVTLWIFFVNPALNSCGAHLHQDLASRLSQSNRTLDLSCLIGKSGEVVVKSVRIGTSAFYDRSEAMWLKPGVALEHTND